MFSPFSLHSVGMKEVKTAQERKKGRKEDFGLAFDSESNDL